MAETNGRFRTWSAFLSGGLVALVLAAGTMLLTLGGERQRVLDHVNSTEPLRTQAVQHFTDEGKHLDTAEAAVMAALPYRLAAIEKKLDELNRKVDRLNGVRE